VRRVVSALCVGFTALVGLAQAAVGPKAATAPVWYRQYPLALGNPVSIACPDQSVCYAAGTDGAVLRTTDSGHTWQRQSAPVHAGFMFRAIACRTSTTCLASADDRGGSLRTVVLATANGGRTWQSQYSTASYEWARLSGKRQLLCAAARSVPCDMVRGNNVERTRSTASDDGNGGRRTGVPRPWNLLHRCA
jgi:hypothetical protein